MVSGAPVSLTADEIVFDYRPYIAGAAPDVNWTGSSIEPATITRKEITSVTAGTQYQVGVRYRIRGALTDRLIIGPVTTGDFAAALSALDPVAAAALAGKGRNFRQATAPLGSVTQEADLWYDTSAGDALYSRGPGTGVLAIGGNALTIGGNHVVVAPWLPVSNPQAVKAAADAAIAIAAAQAAASDSALTPTEKADLAQQRAQVAAERDGLVAKASAQGLSSTTYADAYTALITYLDTLNLGDRVNNSAVDPATLSGRLTSYYTARTALVSATGDLTAANQHSLGDVVDVHVAADYAGTISAGQLPQVRSVRRYVGQSDVSPQTVFTISATSGVTATIDNTAGSAQRGTITITGLAAATGTISITAAYGGVTLYKDVQIFRDMAGAPASGGGGSGASTSTFSSPGSNTTHQVLGTLPSVTVGTGGQVAVSAPLSYTAPSEGNVDVDATGSTATYGAFKAQYQVGGGAWTDAPGGEVQGNAARNFYRTNPPPVGQRNSPGSVSYAVTITGLSSGATVVVRILGRMVSGLSINSVTGTATATPS